MAEFVVDVERHNDGEDGLFGPFGSRGEAQAFIDSDERCDKWSTIRPVSSPGCAQIPADVREAIDAVVDR